MGKIKDIIHGMNNRINADKTFKTELLKACTENQVVIYEETMFGFTVYNVYIVVEPLKEYIGQYAPSQSIIGPPFGETMVNNLKVPGEKYTSYYQISLEELIKHGAKELKEDDLVS